MEEILTRFEHAESFANMPMNEKLIATMIVILLGMGITFIALILIWCITSLMSRIVMSIESKNKPAVTAVEKPVASLVIKEEAEEDDEELIAVITAAIAASLQTSIHNIVVTNITRVADTTPVWGRAGRSDVMNSRF